MTLYFMTKNTKTDMEWKETNGPLGGLPEIDLSCILTLEQIQITCDSNTTLTATCFKPTLRWTISVGQLFSTKLLENHGAKKKSLTILTDLNSLDCVARTQS